MAQRRKRRSSRTKRSSRSRKKHEYPGWVWGMWGLAIGLSVAVAVWVSDRRVQPVVSQIATPESTFDDNGENNAADEVRTAAKVSRFDFYTMLPNFEVIIPEEDPEVAADTGPRGSSTESDTTGTTWRQQFGGHSLPTKQTGGTRIS